MARSPNLQTLGGPCSIGFRRGEEWESLILVTWTVFCESITSRKGGRRASRQGLAGTDPETRRQWDGAWESVPGKSSWGSGALRPATPRSGAPGLQTDDGSVPLATLILARNDSYLFLSLFFPKN